MDTFNFMYFTKSCDAGVLKNDEDKKQVTARAMLDDRHEYSATAEVRARSCKHKNILMLDDRHSTPPPQRYVHSSGTCLTPRPHGRVAAQHSAKNGRGTHFFVSRVACCFQCG